MGRRGVTVRLRYVETFKDRHGCTRRYFRRRGRRVALPGQPSSHEFMVAYSAALAASEPPASRDRPKVVPGSLKALAEEYYRSPDYRRLGASSRKTYRSVLDRFLEAHGHRLVVGMKRRHMTAILGAMSDTPGAAIVLLKRVRTLLQFAVDAGYITANPASRLRSYRSTEIHTWSEEQIGVFCRHWSLGTKQRLAFDVYLY